MADEWFGVKKNESQSIKDVAMQHIRGISELARKEFTPSYWQKKPMKVGDGIAMSEIYHEDKRLAYCNAIDFLLDLMMPHADKTFKDFLEVMEKAEDEDLKKHEEEKKSEDAWIWVKLEYRRKLFGQLMLMITRIKFFEFIPFVDYGHDEDDDDDDDEEKG